MENVTLLVHMLAGFTALAGMIGAILTRKGSRPHRLAGRAYTLGMAVSLVAALAVAVLKGLLFLGLVGVFSSYLVFTGYRLALLRDGKRRGIDRAASAIMLATGAVMVVLGIAWIASGEAMGLVLLVFGLLGGVPALSDWRAGDQWPTGKERIALHLIRFGAASIATVTAVFVVNVNTDPAWIAWLLPSLVGSVMIAVAARRHRAPSAG